MTQVLPAALVAPTQVSLSADAVGYLIRTIAGVEGSFVSNTGTAGAISKVASTGYFYATTGITAPDDGGVLEWYISNAGVKSTFLSAVAIEPAPNQADQAAGIRAALGLASANMDSQFGGIPTTTEIWTHAIRALTDKVDFGLAASQTFSTTGSVGSVTGAVGSVTGAVTVGIINNNVITANAIATDAFDADAIAVSAVTEIQAGLASQASVNAIPTTPLLAANYTAPDNAGIAAIKAKTDNLPVDPADQSELAQLIAAIPQGLTTQQNTRLTQLWQQAGFDSAVPVVRDKEGDVITETIGTTVITHTATNDGDTVITERQP